MLDFLKNHPFAVAAHFEQSVVLTFAVPKEQVQYLIPECLQLDTYQDRYAFVAIAMVQTKGLRPKGLPQFMGNDFFLIGYRVFVKYINNKGKRLRGLYILKSETDKKKMELLGNIFTHYNYTTTDIAERTEGEHTHIKSIASDFEIDWQRLKEEDATIPAGSPFTEWADARRFSGPLPFTFTYNQPKKEVLIIEGVREKWKPQPIKINNFHIPFLEKLGLTDAKLASAFVVEDIPYYWKKGRIETWQG